MKSWLKIKGRVGSGFYYEAVEVVYINPNRIGDTIFKSNCIKGNSCFKIEYGDKYLYVDGENLQIILNYFKASNRDEKIDQILND